MHGGRHCYGKQRSPKPYFIFRGTPIGDEYGKELALRNSASLVRTLRVPTFRNLLIGDLVSDIAPSTQDSGRMGLLQPPDSSSRIAHRLRSYSRQLSEVWVQALSTSWSSVRQRCLCGIAFLPGHSGRFRSRSFQSQFVALTGNSGE
jgi:hypothetical protein